MAPKVMISKAGLKEKIRPLWIILSKRWGGAEQVAMSDMVDMVQAGVKIGVLCLKGTPVHAAAIRHPGLEVLTVDYLFRHRFDWQFISQLRESILKFQANIVHVNDERLLWYLEPALYKQKNISILSSRYTLVPPSYKDFFRALLWRRLDYVVVLSESIKKSLFHRNSVAEKKIKVINLGLDFSRFDPQKSNGSNLRKSWGVDNDTVVIGSVGRLVPEVGQDTFIKAAAGLLKYSERKVKFVIVDEDPMVASSEYLDELRALIAGFHMQEHVVLTSLQDNLPETMAAFDIFVMSGREEVPGLGALEAMAMERAVVVSRVFGAEDIVGRNEFGLLVRPEDAFDLQAKILKLLKNPSQRELMGVRGRQHVLRHFDKRTRFLRSLDLYERCYKRRLAFLERAKNA